MSEIDRELRLRVWLRRLTIVLGVIAIGMFIGLAVGRRAAPSAPISEGTPTITERPTLFPTIDVLGPTAPAATLAPEDIWRVLARESFEIASTWPITDADGWSAGYEEGRYRMQLNGKRVISYGIPLDVSEFRVDVDVQIKSGHAGLLFLSGDENIFYRFLIDGAGNYRLERQQGEEIAALYDWTASSVLKGGPDAINKIEIQFVEREVKLFANNTELAAYTLPADESVRGRAGLAIATPNRNESALAYFDNLEVRSPTVPNS